MESLLYGAGAVRFITTPAIIRLATSNRPGLSENTIHLWIKHMTETGKLLYVRRGLYANLRALPEVMPLEAAQYIRSGAIVTLHSVLGDVGFLNNPSRLVFAVVPLPTPLSTKGSLVRSVNIGTVKTGIGEFRFHGLPAHLMDNRAGQLEDREQQSKCYRKATPEKALLDWLYLAKSPHSKLVMPPLDVDFDELNQKRLKRLAENMGLKDTLAEYVNRVQKYYSDEDVQMNASNTLGF